MTWYTTSEEMKQALEKGDEYLRSNGIDQAQRTHIRSLIGEIYEEYREKFGEVPFRLITKKAINKVFVLLEVKCESYRPACAGQPQIEGISPPLWHSHRRINTVTISLEAMLLDKEAIRTLFDFMGDDKKTFIRAALYRLLTMALVVIEPLLAANIISGISASQVEKIFMFATLVLADTLVGGVFTYVASKMLRKSYTTMIRNMRFAMAENVLKITTGCVERNSSGVFSQRLISETDNCADYLDELLGELTELFRLISLLISFGVIEPSLMLYEILVVAIYFIIQRAQISNITNDSRFVRTANENQLGFVGEMFKGHRDIKLLHCEGSFLGRMKQSINTTLDLILNMRVKSMRFIMIRTSFSGLSNYLFILMLVVMISRQNIDPASALVLYNFNSQLSSSGIRSVSELTSTLFNLGLSVERIWQMMYGSDFAHEEFGDTALDEVRGELEIRDVAFAYGNDSNRVEVLKHLNLTIHAGESVAFVGRSGCGKSTILSLITRLYDPEAGEILLDGVPTRELTRDTLRGSISMVSQAPYIFNMSIRDNLRVVDADLTEEDMVRACRFACIHDDIMNFPQGYDTEVGEGGTTLSGGQRQRLALARCILRNDPVILLDEATSALDNETQAEIHHAMENIRGNHTLLMVAHRLSTVINCDRLFLIENGKVAAEGTHEQLLKGCEAYRRLYQTELGEEAKRA